MNEKPNYYSIIPADVRYDTELKDKSKLLYGEITALCNKDGICYASNKYFADLYSVSTTTISLLIKELIEKEYLESEIVYKENTKEIDKRYLRILKGGYLRNLKGGYLRNLKHNNININNNKENNISKDIFKRKFFENDKLNKLFIEFLEQRKKLKAINSERAIKQLLDKLEPYDDLTKEQMIEESLVNSWKSVFPIKAKKDTKQNEWWRKYEN